MRAVGGSPEPVVDLLLRPTRRLCGESVTGNLHSASTPAPGPSPVVLPMLFMVNATGLAIWRGIVVLCRFLAGAMAPAPALFPSAVYRADAHRASGAQTRPRLWLAIGWVKGAGNEGG